MLGYPYAELPNDIPIKVSTKSAIYVVHVDGMSLKLANARNSTGLHILGASRMPQSAYLYIQQQTKIMRIDIKRFDATGNK
jgi:hypothetical protein